MLAATGGFGLQLRRLALKDIGLRRIGHGGRRHVKPSRGLSRTPVDLMVFTDTSRRIAFGGCQGTSFIAGHFQPSPDMGFNAGDRRMVSGQCI